MFCQPGFDQWLTTIRTHLPQLSKPQATVLALWSLGMVLARSCAVTAVSVVLAKGLRRKDQSVRQQLREWCYEAQDKRGQQRQALRVETCFPVLLAWVVSWWDGTQLALAMDATAVGTRFVVLAISVVYRGCAIPVAWVVLAANTTHAWRREWLRMLRKLRPAIPKGWTVIVLADRGLYAPWLFRRIVKLGWHPFLRINTGGTFRPAGQPLFQPLANLAPQPGTRWHGRGTAFKTKGSQIECTLLACWEEGYKAPWLILTDLPPEASDAGWYGLRAWIEQGFKITKRAGGQWHRWIGVPNALLSPAPPPFSPCPPAGEPHTARPRRGDEKGFWKAYTSIQSMRWNVPLQTTTDGATTAPTLSYTATPPVIQRKL